MRDWLLALTADDRRIIGHDLATVEFGWPMGMPLCKPLGQGLWEVRSDVSDGTIARIMFCIVNGEMVLLHGFVKKSRKTPTADIGLARKRQKEIA